MSSEWAEQPAAPDNHGVPGRTLAAQREAMGWTVEQVADQLKLAVRQVVALEAGDYASLPSPAVVRGFVRAYAKIVKLDPMPLVAQIALEAPGPTDATGTTVRREQKSASFAEVRFPTYGKRASLPIVPIAIFVVVAAAAAAWHFGLLSGLIARGTAPAASTAVLQPNAALVQVPAAAGTTPAMQANALQNPSVPLISVPPPSTTTAGSPAANVAATAAPAAAAGANALVINVREDSWIEVRRAAGAPLIARLVKAGGSETFDITEPVTLVVGKPSAVGATLRGAAVALPPVAGSSVSRVNLK
ncbi:helix-turn-helix domain-containing protein [Massilia eurypsychrophila]|uniref:Helix-turn-helix domain-containing protein n=1 Tax=Massilia eurypsychrophila TaxID=1485217 RepID=A0A2G8T8X2_9BURK|nr:helix-turn-helix domain-containing protein [Massilia eurypsychrophila]PIL42505.1 helix-turn-helix domain-containing protein [Massilia eurypsychrophila]